MVIILYLVFSCNIVYRTFIYNGCKNRVLIYVSNWRYGVCLTSVPKLMFELTCCVMSRSPDNTAIKEKIFPKLYHSLVVQDVWMRLSWMIVFPMPLFRELLCTHFGQRKNKINVVNKIPRTLSSSNLSFMCCVKCYQKCLNR